jgi:hypothetical protein
MERAMTSTRQPGLIGIGVAQARALATASCVTLLVASATQAVAQDAQPNRINIEYLEPKNPALKPIMEAIKKNRGLERIQEIFSPVRLNQPLTVRAMECGMSNAWYARPVVTICYEYLDDIFKTAPKETGPTGLTPDDAILGQAVYVIAHEMGHALFDALNVPLFGRPEDAADQFAAYIMLLLGKNEARRLIGGAAYTYKEYIDKPKVVVPQTAFADVHGAPMQRLYNLLCIAYGADREQFKDVVEQGYLPKDRAGGCRVEYGEVDFAFKQLIRPNIDQALANVVQQKNWLPTESLARPDPPPPPPQLPKQQ